MGRVVEELLQTPQGYPRCTGPLEPGEGNDRVQGWVQTTGGRSADRIGCCIVSVVSVFNLAPAQAG